MKRGKTVSEINVRALALNGIIEILEQGVNCDTALHKILRENEELSKQDKSFLTRLVEGCTERQIELDYIIDTFSNTKVKKMKPPIRNILRMGVYQLKYMDKVPDSAACNEAVKLTVKRKFHNLRGFVNGVLRNIARKGTNLDYAVLIKDKTKQLHIVYSMPEWIVDYYLETFGLDITEKILSSYYEDKPLTISINQLAIEEKEYLAKLDKEQIEWEKVKNIDGCYRIAELSSVRELPGYEDGEFWVQDASSQISVQKAGIKPGDTILDICAAPGGKSLYAAMLTGEKGKVSSRDLTDKKVDKIRENQIRMKFSQIEPKVFDGTQTDTEWIEKADVVISDVPCSGLGVIGKKPDIKYHITREAIDSLVKLQREIVTNAAKYVKPGGILMYSTCTITKEENQNNRKWIEENLDLVFGGEERQFLPGVDKEDGFYYARFIKREHRM